MPNIFYLVSMHQNNTHDDINELRKRYINKNQDNIKMCTKTMYYMSPIYYIHRICTAFFLQGCASFCVCRTLEVIITSFTWYARLIVISTLVNCELKKEVLVHWKLFAKDFNTRR